MLGTVPPGPIFSNYLRFLACTPNLNLRVTLQQILILKEAILFSTFFHENSIDRKKIVDHDEASGKSHKTVISDFLFLKLYHRDFSLQSFFLLHFFQKPKKRPFCSVNFAMKIEPTEKMEYTMTKPTENPMKLLSQTFEFFTTQFLIIKKKWFSDSMIRIFGFGGLWINHHR